MFFIFSLRCISTRLESNHISKTRRGGNLFITHTSVSWSSNIKWIQRLFCISLVHKQPTLMIWKWPFCYLNVICIFLGLETTAMIFLKVWKSWFVASGDKSSRCLDLNLNHNYAVKWCEDWSHKPLDSVSCCWRCCLCCCCRTMYFLFWRDMKILLVDALKKRTCILTLISQDSILPWHQHCTMTLWSIQTVSINLLRN